MKRTLITKIGEYENITSEVDSLEEAFDEYTAIKSIFGDREGLPDKEWNAVTDGYLTTNTMKAEEYESLSREQKNYIQWAKRAFKRLSNNNK